MYTVTKAKVLFSKYCQDLGDIQIQDFNLKNDVARIHDWVTKPYAKYWGMQKSTIKEVAAVYRKIDASKHYHVCVGMLGNKLIFLMEYYDPSQDIISDHYEVQRGDIGMHLLVAPVEKKIPKFTWNVFTTVMDFLFANQEVKRIVVEPDITNQKIHILNTKAGFQYFKEIQLPNKTAHLAVCTRTDYENAIQKNNSKQYNS